MLSAGLLTPAWCWHHIADCWLSVICWPPLSEENRRKQFSPPPPQSPPSLLPENEDGLRTRWDIETVCSYKLLMSLLMMITLNDAFTVFQSLLCCVKSYVFPHYSGHKRSFPAISDILISPPSSMFANPERKQLGKSAGEGKSRGQQNILKSYRAFAIKIASSLNASQTFDRSLSAAKRLTSNKLKLSISIQRTLNKLLFIETYLFW